MIPSVPPAREEPDAPRCIICGKRAFKQDIDGDWWPPCEHAAKVGLHTLLYDDEVPARVR